MAQMGHNATWGLGMRLPAALLHEQRLLILHVKVVCGCTVYSTSTRGTPVSRTQSSYYYTKLKRCIPTENSPLNTEKFATRGESWLKCCHVVASLHLVLLVL